MTEQQAERIEELDWQRRTELMARDAARDKTLTESDLAALDCMDEVRQKVNAIREIIREAQDELALLRTPKLNSDLSDIIAATGGYIESALSCLAKAAKCCGENF